MRVFRERSVWEDWRERGCWRGSAHKRVAERQSTSVRRRERAPRRTWLTGARHERREAREAHVADRREAREARGTTGARHERREAVVLWVDAQKGSCDSFFSFLYWVYV